MNENLTRCDIHINEYLKILCEMQTHLVEKKKALAPIHSSLDKKQEELLHLLELESLSAPQRARATKMLVKIRKERRKVKMEMNDITNALKAFKMAPHKQLSYKYEFKYSYEEDTIKEVFGEEK